MNDQPDLLTSLQWKRYFSYRRCTDYTLPIPPRSIVKDNRPAFVSFPPQLPYHPLLRRFLFFFLYCFCFHYIFFLCPFLVPHFPSCSIPHGGNRYSPFPAHFPLYIRAYEQLITFLLRSVTRCFFQQLP